jgi:hypothetical protein
MATRKLPFTLHCGRPCYISSLCAEPECVRADAVVVPDGLNGADRRERRVLQWADQRETRKQITSMMACQQEPYVPCRTCSPS